MAKINEKAEHIKIHPSVISQLGESLITDEVQALIELVKNSYDADASYVKINIKIPTKEEYQDKNNSFLGEIIIEDDGIGMSKEDIISGWLHISNRRKLNQKKNKILTKKGRTPLGDKGLGRLGIQKLGNILEIETKAEDRQAHTFKLDWREFEKADKLDEINILLEEIEKDKRGTKLKIEELRSPLVWIGQEAQDRLKNEFSTMISPYEKIRKFIVFLEVNGKKIDLLTIPEHLRKTAHIQYALNYDENKLSVTAKISKNWFKSKLSNEEKKIFNTDMHYSQFVEYLKKFKSFEQYKMKDISENSTWLLEYSTERALEDLDGVEMLENTLFNKEEPANPGKFEGEIDYFDFRDKNELELKSEEYKKLVKALDGIRVFRDGFGVRTPGDWLKIGSGSTSGTYYSLRQDNTHGYIAISAKHNSQLEETTAREKFKDTPYYRNFVLLLTEFIDFTDKTNNFFGRKWGDYRKEERDKSSTMELGDISSVKETIKKQNLEIKQQKEEIVTYKEETQKSIETAKVAVSKVKEQQKINEPITKTEIDNLDLTIKSLENVIKTSEELLPKLDKQIVEFDKLDKFAQVIEDRIESKTEQLHDALELALLGLTAETLSHEIYNITDTLLLRSKDIKTKISPQDIPLLTYNEYVISTATALRKQVSFLDPALKYVRDKKDNLELKSFLEEFISCQNERLKEDKIELVLQSQVSKTNITINKGKLIQIFDNLINNSVYWLKKEAAIDKKIYLELSKNAKVQIWDTGKGIDPAVEYNLFDPFVTAKYDKVNKVKGRGLGLYIIKQLLEYDNCSIELLPEKNKNDRYYKFQLDFTGVIHG